MRANVVAIVRLLTTNVANSTGRHSLRLLASAGLLLMFWGSSAAQAQGLTAVIATNKGEIRVALNERAAPTTVANFANLATRGFYDGLSFHRWERNFMIQGGDPRGNGTGGPGYEFQGELILHHNQAGIISMANSGPGTEGSQFFLTHVATPHLDGKHSVFGKVSAGLPVVQQLRRGDQILSVTIEGDPSSVFRRRAEQLAEWNAILDSEFPDLKPALSVGGDS